MKIIDRVIYKEIVPMFFGGVVAFTALILGVGALYQMIRVALDYNASFLWVIQIFLLKLPEIVGYTLPMSALFCVLLGFSRFSGDLEITAFRAGGISFVRLMVPVLLFAFVVSLLALLLNDRIVPMSNTRFNILLDEIKQKASTEMKKDNLEYADWENGLIKNRLYASQVDGSRLKNPIYEEFKEGIMVRQTRARDAILSGNYWHFKNGEQLIFSDMGELKNIVKFEGMDIIFKQKLEDLAREKTKAGDYTFRELSERIKILEEKRIDKPALRKLQVDYYSKLAIPFASFTFALIAAPLGLRPQRASSSVGFGISVIIIFFYYISQALFRGLGQAFLNPALAAWLSNLILIAIGVCLIHKASK
jgi:lipopolysaccharide export system permease protein